LGSQAEVPFLSCDVRRFTVKAGIAPLMITRPKATYRTGTGSRAGSMLEPAFAAALTAAEERIRIMESRYVEEADQNRQALLEIYCDLQIEFELLVE
jgi:hypothetical protein